MTQSTVETYTEPIVFHKVSQLYLAAHKRVLKFKKPERYTLGVRIENTILEIIELLYLAQSKQGASRLLILNKADVTLKMLTTHLRLAYKTGSINDAGFASLSEKIIEIGSMVGGWIKYTKNPTPLI
ncbi:MAG: four helix bundle protein [Patescibacteria group bacterium]